MDLEEIKNLVIYIAGEKGVDITLSPEQYCNGLHLASLKHFKRKIGLPEEYSPGMPLPRQAYEITERITEDMRRFKRVKGWHYNQAITVLNGVALFPEDYYMISSLTYFLTENDKRMERKIHILSDLEFQDYTTSITKNPDRWFPACNIQSTFLRIRPESIKLVNMVYLVMPQKPYYAYKYVNDFMEYDHENSKQLEWDDVNIIDIIAIYLGDLGIKISNADLVGYAENIKTKGI